MLSFSDEPSEIVVPIGSTGGGSDRRQPSGAVTVIVSLLAQVLAASVGTAVLQLPDSPCADPIQAAARRPTLLNGRVRTRRA